MNQMTSYEEYVARTEATRVKRRAWEVSEPQRAGRFGVDLVKANRALTALHELPPSEAIRAALSFLAYVRMDMEGLMLAICDDAIKGGDIDDHDEDDLHYAERVADEASEYFGRVQLDLAGREGAWADYVNDTRGDA